MVKNAFSKVVEPGVGGRERVAQDELDGFLAAQVEVGERLAGLRVELAGAVAERDRLDALIGTDDEDDLAFTRLGEADVRVKSLERRVVGAEAGARQADDDVASARVTVRYRRAHDLAEWLVGFDRVGLDAAFLAEVQPLFDRYQDALYVRDHAEDEAFALAQELRFTPGAQVDRGVGYVMVAGVHVDTPSYKRASDARDVFAGAVDRRAAERARLEREAAAERAAERDAEAERMRQLDRERLAYAGAAPAESGAPVRGTQRDQRFIGSSFEDMTNPRPAGAPDTGAPFGN